MGEDCLCIYLPGNLVHWDRPGKNLLHLESKALPRSLGFTSAIPSEPPLTQHPAFCPSLTMAASNLSTGTSAPSLNHTEYDVPTPLPIPEHPTLREIAKLIDHDQAFENTSTSVAASQMRNALNNLADTVEDPTEKKVRSL